MTGGPDNYTREECEHGIDKAYDMTTCDHIIGFNRGDAFQTRGLIRVSSDKPMFVGPPVTQFKWCPLCGTRLEDSP